MGKEIDRETTTPYNTLDHAMTDFSIERWQIILTL